MPPQSGVNAEFSSEWLVGIDTSMLEEVQCPKY